MGAMYWRLLNQLANQSKTKTMKTIKSTNRPIEQLFIQFLKDNGALIPFCINLSKATHRPLFNHLHLNLNWVLLGDFIKTAFLWNNTKEGIEYWHLLNEEWYRTLDTFLCSIASNDSDFQTLRQLI
jgi:hypothetical protein